MNHPGQNEKLHVGKMPKRADLSEDTKKRKQICKTSHDHRCKLRCWLRRYGLYLNMDFAPGSLGPDLEALDALQLVGGWTYALVVSACPGLLPSRWAPHVA